MAAGYRCMRIVSIDGVSVLGRKMVVKGQCKSVKDHPYKYIWNFVISQIRASLLI